MTPRAIALGVIKLSYLRKLLLAAKLIDADMRVGFARTKNGVRETFVVD